MRQSGKIVPLNYTARRHFVQNYPWRTRSRLVFRGARGCLTILRGLLCLSYQPFRCSTLLSIVCYGNEVPFLPIAAREAAARNFTRKDGMLDTRNLLAKYLGLHDTAHVEDVLRLLIALGAQVVGADEGSLLLAVDAEAGADGDDLLFVMTLGNDTSEKRLIGLRVPMGQGITGMAAITREVQIGGPLYRLKSDIDNGSPPEGDTRTVMAAPMLVDDELVGVITAVTFDPDKTFTAQDARLYGRLAAVAGVVVGQQRRLQELLTDGKAKRLEIRENAILDDILRMGAGDPARLADLKTLLAIVARLANLPGGEG